MPSVFVVIGQSGEYSDRRDWPVAAYTDRALAERHEFAATKRAKEFHDTTCEHGERMCDFCSPCNRWDLDAALPVFMGPLDPNARSYCGRGADYFTLEVPLRTKPPKGA